MYIHLKTLINHHETTYTCYSLDDRS